MAAKPVYVNQLGQHFFGRRQQVDDHLASLNHHAAYTNAVGLQLHAIRRLH